MSTDVGYLQRELETAIEAVRAGGEILMQEYRKFHRDGHATDFGISREIGHILRGNFPGYGFLDEELAEDRSRLDGERCWVVDPLDGTMYFESGEDTFGMLVGLIEDFYPVLGVVSQPHRGNLFYAVKGKGAHCIHNNGEPQKIEVSDLNLLRVVTSRGGCDADELLKNLGSPIVTAIGSATEKALYVATGRATVYISPPPVEVHLWDICAPTVVIEEAGGRVTGFNNKPLNYRNTDTRIYDGIIASNGKVHDKVVEAVCK